MSSLLDVWAEEGVGLRQRRGTNQTSCANASTLPALEMETSPLRYISARCLFLCSGSQNIHPFLSVSPRASFVFQMRAGENTLIWSSPPSMFQAHASAYVPVGCLKCLLTPPCYPGALAYACDLHIEGCSCRLVLYETMKPSVFMHTSVLAMAASACVFTSYHTPLPLTPTSLHCALIPPRLSGLPYLTLFSFIYFFVPTVPCGNVTYATLPLCTCGTGNTEDRRQCLSWFFREQGKTKRNPGAVSQVQKTSREKKGKYGLLTAGVCMCRQQAQE